MSIPSSILFECSSHVSILVYVYIRYITWRTAHDRDRQIYVTARVHLCFACSRVVGPRDTKPTRRRWSFRVLLVSRLHRKWRDRRASRERSLSPPASSAWQSRAIIHICSGDMLYIFWWIQRGARAIKTQNTCICVYMRRRAVFLLFLLS